MDHYWYANSVGKVFRVTGETSNDYMVALDDTSDTYYVEKSDCEPVIEHNGKFYREVKRKAQVGDKILITKSFDVVFHEGDITEVTRIDSDGNRWAYEDYYTEWCIDEDNGVKYTVLEPVIEHDGKFYRGVKRNAQVGELIMITADEMLGEHHQGEIYNVTEIDGDLVNTNGFWDDGSILNPRSSEYTVLEPVEVADQPEAPIGPTTQHEAIANLALKVAELEKDVKEALASVSVVDHSVKCLLERINNVEKSNPADSHAELQLAILRADLPLDFRLDLIREAERLRNERLALIESTRGLDE